MTSTNEYSIHIYFIYKLIITRIAQLNDIESVIIYLRVLSGHRFDVDIERTIGNGFSRNRRLHSLSLSLSLSTTIVHAHFGIPFVVSRIYIHVHNNRTARWFHGTIGKTIGHAVSNRSRRNIPENEYLPPDHESGRIESKQGRQD